MLSPLLLPLLLSRLVLLPLLLTRLGQGLSRLAAVCTGDRLVGLLTGGGRRTEARPGARAVAGVTRSEEHTSELQSLMRISYAVFCLKKKKKKASTRHTHSTE